MYYACTFRSRLILTLHPARTDTGQIFLQKLKRLIEKTRTIEKSGYCRFTDTRRVDSKVLLF